MCADTLAQVTEQTSPGAGGPVEGGPAGDAAGDQAGDPADDRLAEAEAALRAANERLLRTPAEDIVVNHVMGLYQLAALHLSAAEPGLRDAQLAIDAMACLVEGLGERLDEHADTMRDALSNIRLLYVQIKRRSSGAEAPAG